MIISPPFLPANNNLAEDAWIDDAMRLDLPNNDAPRGVFPVGQNLGWHGGLHLVAPMNGAVALPVRAIADGTVVYLRQPSGVTEPLNYDPAMVGASRTDDGCVVIRHETEIGATAAGVATSVTFYSIYMHLATVTCANQVIAGVAQQRATPFPILRKDEIGTAGRIYGQSNRIHFEIIFDDAALQNILGRTLTQPAAGADGTAAAHTLDLAATSDGRSDAVFGEIYFRLPVGTTFYAARPALNVTAPTAAATHTLTEEQIVGMKFAAGEGPQANRGDISYRTYQLDGTEIGAAIPETDGEYNLYTTANDISRAYPATGRPAPSAVYELLRFGRILDTVNETLTPAEVPMWKDVNYAGGHGWVNLHATGIHVYSDADLPQWKGWQVVDSDNDADSRCDAARIWAILDQDGDGTIAPAEATTRIGDADIRKQLSRFLCKMPTEWEAASIDTRWGWLKTSNPENPTPFDDVRDYQPFKAHVTALCFWQAANLGIPATHWHAHPIEFIRHFRKCGWMNSRELAQMIPHVSNASGRITWVSALQRVEDGLAGANMAPNLGLNISRIARKYSVERAARRAHFLSQIWQETGLLRYATEFGGDRYFRTMYEVITAVEAGEDYDRAVERRRQLPSGQWPETPVTSPPTNPIAPANTPADRIISRANYLIERPPQIQAKAAELGNNQNGDGPRFRGRGMIQLTGRSNYSSYGTYRSRNFTTDPSPLLLASNAFYTADVAGKFWASFVVGGQYGINRRADQGVTNTEVRSVTRAVNPALKELENRQEYFRFMFGVLADLPTPPNTATLVRQTPTP